MTQILENQLRQDALHDYGANWKEHSSGQAYILLEQYRKHLERISNLGSDGEHSKEKHAQCRKIAIEGLRVKP